MSHPVELAASKAISGLRLDHQPRNENDTLRLNDGVYFSWDAGKGDVTLDVRPELGALLHLTASVRKAPDWLTFNIDLGESSFAAGDILGLVVEFEGCAGEALPLFVRSARKGTLSDTWLTDKLSGTETRNVQVLFHQIKPEDPLTGGPAHHTLVLPLPKRDFALELRDMRIFVIPEDRGLKLGAPTLSEA